MATFLPYCIFVKGPLHFHYSLSRASVALILPHTNRDACPFIYFKFQMKMLLYKQTKV
jgi:hypothetical protein